MMTVYFHKVLYSRLMLICMLVKYGLLAETRHMKEKKRKRGCDVIKFVNENNVRI